MVRFLAVVLAVGFSSCAALAQQAEPVRPAPPAHAADPAPRAASEAQRWKGSITLPGVTLDFSVTLTPGTGETPASGTIDIPQQGVKGAPLSDVGVTPEKITFTLALPTMPADMRAVFTAVPAPDARTASGELLQGGVRAKVSMERVAIDADLSPQRPQTPKPPFPYVAREVTYTNAKDGTKLAGTLTIPEVKGPHPAAILITGSGAQDRDESLLGHRPFLVLADYLSRHGIAVLRADDRGVGGSTGNVSRSTSADFAGDVLAGVAMLKALPEIDSKRIGVIGHSEGGIVGPLAAAESPDVAFVVMLAGTGFKGRDILTMQSEAIARASGADEALIARATTEHRALMDLLEQGAPDDRVREALRALTLTQLAMSGAANLPAEQVNAGVDQAFESLQTPWFRSFLTLDPSIALRRVRVPVLAINGGLDVQVPAKENLASIERALREGGNTRVTVKEMPGLNHLFQAATTGSPDEYARIEETFNPAALQVIEQWLRENFGAGAK